MRKKPPHELSAKFTDPDLVDRMFDFICELCPEIVDRAEELKRATRAEFRGEEVYIPKNARTERQAKVQEVMRLFNGRNATEVARRLNISRRSVYRWVKQSG